MSAGLMGFVGGVGKGMAVVAEKAIDDEYTRMKEERIAENALRMDETKRARDLAGATAERAREDAAAKGIAEQRTGLIAERQGLNDADYRGDENTGVNVQKGQAVPNNRDYLGAQRKFSELARLDESDQAQARQEARDATADAKDVRDYELRKKQADIASRSADMQYKTAKLAYERASADAKIPPAVDRAMKSRDEELKAINTQITKLQGDNLPVGEALLARKSAVVKEINTLIEPYLPEDARSKLADGGKPDTDKAHADAKAALATGRISLAEANKRLVSKGLPPLPDEPTAPAAGEPTAPAAGGNEIQKIDAEIATIRTSLNTDKTRRTNPLKGGGELLSTDEASRLEARLSELKTRRQKLGGSPIMDAARGIINSVRN